MRQIAGAFAEYEKRRLVRKLREARERSDRLGGRKSYAEAMPETVALAQRLAARDSPIARSALSLLRKATLRAAASRMWRLLFKRCLGASRAASPKNSEVSNTLRAFQGVKPFPSFAVMELGEHSVT
jgi:hypothetical protein